MEMVVAAYNADKGGFDTYTDYESKKPPQLEMVQRSVGALDADTTLLPDTFRWHEVFTEADLRKIFGYDYATTMPIRDRTRDRAAADIGITILSRRELINPAPVNLGERFAICCLFASC